MLTPDPQVLRTLLSRHATLCIALLERETAHAQHALEDVSYTLCVLTGTRTVTDAILTADGILDRSHRSSTASAVTSCPPGQPLAA
ncbi:DUF5133 domain-containing protein [Streptomyces sp. NBC_00344]|uniref:DUF5133 domain-containing protein n=1 Tax=Streptomyces sp. NBC_00344 TaxID=2975720 RepID=UPI002E1E1063